MSEIVSFYLGQSRDWTGRSIDDVWAYSHGQLEAVHNYIQWLFPLRTPGVAPAPLLDDETAEAFRTTPQLRERLLRSFDLMLDFYGLKRETDAVAFAETFAKRGRVWVTPYNHNFLRITRILRCLRECGLEAEARAFFRCLEAIRQQHAAVIGRSWDFWREAAGG